MGLIGMYLLGVITGIIALSILISIRAKDKQISCQQCVEELRRKQNVLV